MNATIGRIVHYQLNAVDADTINGYRRDSNALGHTGNDAAEGQVYPALVVRDWGGSVNLQVFLDGNDSYWATSRSEGDGAGQWAWPVKS